MLSAARCRRTECGLHWGIDVTTDIQLERAARRSGWIYLAWANFNNLAKSLHQVVIGQEAVVDQVLKRSPDLARTR